MIQTMLRSLSRELLAASLRLGAGALGILLFSGCTTTLEDGYKPRGLEATPELRKAYYASPFTDDANGGGKGGSGPQFGPGR